MLPEKLINEQQAKFVFSSNTIRKDGMVNATALTTAYRNATGARKDSRDWLKTNTAKESIEFLHQATGIPVAQLVIVENGVGTWMHPDLAEIFAQWVSVEYRFAVVALIRREKDNSNPQPEGMKTPRHAELEAESALLSQKTLLIDLYGKEVTMVLMGQKDQLVQTTTYATEIVNPVTGNTDRILTADQLKRAIADKTGQKPKTMSAVVAKIRAAGRDDLLVPVTRSSTSEYIKAECLEEALEVLYGKEKQELIKPVGQLVKK